MSKNIFFSKKYLKKILVKKNDFFEKKKSLNGKNSSFGFTLCQCGHFEPIPDLFSHSYQDLLEFGEGICPKTNFGIFPKIV